MRELDELLIRFLDRSFDQLAGSSQAAFEELLTLQDPEILDLLAGRQTADDPVLNEVIQRILAPI